MYNVYQHWDPLKVCVVGRSYPPEFYSWVTHAKTRNLLEKIAVETEEDYQKIISKLESFDVSILRPDCVNHLPTDRNYKKIPPPPMTPRDSFVMIDDTLYRHENNWEIFYSNVRDQSWPEYTSSMEELSSEQKKECVSFHKWGEDPFDNWSYKNIVDQVTASGNTVKLSPNKNIVGSMVSRIGKDLYIATSRFKEEEHNLKNIADREFSNHRTHIVNTLGHSDGTFCPVAPGLIISLYDIPTFKDTFPDWEVVYLPDASWRSIPGWGELKRKNQGRWWIADAKTDDNFINFVDTWMSDWVGYVEETVFDVNMLIIDPKNVIVFNENEKVFKVLEKYGITPHVVPFRHRYFWDGGIHCITLDLHREGTMQDYFPNRK